MIQVHPNDFLNRVFTGRELVKFTFCDPYNHMATGQYMEMALNLRTEAPIRQAGFDVIQYMIDPGIGFATVGIEAQFLRPCKLGEYLELSSWATEYSEDGFKAKVMFIGELRKDFRAGIRFSFKSVTVKDGRPCKMPETYPSSFPENAFLKLPLVDDYMNDVRLVPKSFLV